MVTTVRTTRLDGSAGDVRRSNRAGGGGEADASPPEMGGAARGPQRLSSVATSIALLKCFSETEVEIGVSSLARQLGVAKSTVHRLAVTLVSEGMLEQNPENGKYRLGIALFSLGALVRRRMNLSSEARQDLFALRNITQETVHLAILDRAEIMYVYNLESTQAIRVNSDIGVHKPAFCTANGRAILAFQGDDRIEAVIAHGLTARAPKTNTKPAHFRKVLAEVRKLGYAIEDEESEAGMRALAAPVRDSSGLVVASVGIAGPVQRLSNETMKAFAPAVVDTAASISRRLGYINGSVF